MCAYVAACTRTPDDIYGRASYHSSSVQLLTQHHRRICADTCVCIYIDIFTSNVYACAYLLECVVCVEKFQSKWKVYAESEIRDIALFPSSNRYITAFVAYNMNPCAPPTGHCAIDARACTRDASATGDDDVRACVRASVPVRVLRTVARTLAESGWWR